MNASLAKYKQDKILSIHWIYIISFFFLFFAATRK